MTVDTNPFLAWAFAAMQRQAEAITREYGRLWQYADAVDHATHAGYHGA